MGRSAHDVENVVPRCYQRSRCSVKNARSITGATLPKIIHTMIRVLDLERSITFYAKGFGFAETHRLAYPDFTLVYLKNPESAFEIELTHNHDRTTPYTHGDGYGHYAFVTDDLEESHRDLSAIGAKPLPIKEFKKGDDLLARFFFVQDPDGYKIEVLGRGGHYR